MGLSLYMYGCMHMDTVHMVRIIMVLLSTTFSHHLSFVCTVYICIITASSSTMKRWRYFKLVLSVAAGELFAALEEGRNWPFIENWNGKMPVGTLYLLFGWGDRWQEGRPRLNTRSPFRCAGRNVGWRWMKQMFLCWFQMMVKVIFFGKHKEHQDVFM